MQTVLKVVELNLSGYFPQIVAENVIVSMKKLLMNPLDCNLSANDVITFLVAFNPNMHALEAKEQ